MSLGLGRNAAMNSERSWGPLDAGQNVTCVVLSRKGSRRSFLNELFSLIPTIARYYCGDIYDYTTTKILDGGRRSRHCRIRGDVSRHPGDGGRHNSAGGIECYECILERCQFASIMLMP